MATTNLLTAEDLLRMTEPGRYDLIRGELIQMSPSGGVHGEIGTNLIVLLGSFVLERRLGRVYTADTGFKLSTDPDTVLSPDAAFVAMDRLPPRANRSGFLQLAPDLAVEIVSPSDYPRLVATKVDMYLASGTRVVWVAYSSRREVVVYLPGVAPTTFTSAETLDGGDVLPGFRTPVSAIFD
jgi:Uma2 family endonuclease